MAGGLDSAHAKIVRALDQHEPIEKCIADYRSRHPYRKIIHSDGNATLEITEQPPIEISVIAGEIIYHLRSALDHMFFDLVRRSLIGPFPKGFEKTIEFPLCINPPGDPMRFPPIPRTSFGGSIPSFISDEAFAIIERLQPYNRRNDGHRLLRMLRIFSNIDKHRHLNTTVAVITRKHIIHGKGGISSTIVTPMLTHGTELYEPMHPIEIQKSAVEVEDKYIVEIAFDEPEFGPLESATIEDVMYYLPTWVFRIGGFFREFFS